MTDQDRLESMVEDLDDRLSRIERALGLAPTTEEQRRKEAQDRWFRGHEAWADDARRRRAQRDTR